MTGGAGFFGKAFVRWALANQYSDRICIYSRDEAKHAGLRAETGNDERMRFFLGDVRDTQRLTRACHGVDVVIHAAALKRIEVGYYDPAEMALTNIIGTQSVVDACLSTGAKAVLLSTDKACEPISPYGYSKAIAEAVFVAAGQGFSVVRYGNVANSTGSVIPTWRDATGTVRITDPDATRFWMTVDEAVKLVIDTIENGAELAIPNLPAYRLGDLADAMGLETEITGLPEWEKKHESLVSGRSSDIARRMSVEELRESL